MFTVVIDEEDNILCTFSLSSFLKAVFSPRINSDGLSVIPWTNGMYNMVMVNSFVVSRFSGEIRS